MSFDEVKSALEASAAAVIEGPQVVSRAAVSAVLRPGQSGLEGLLIRRAKRDGAPWSGHMAFPGGRSEDHDRDLLETAVREPREEIGLDLRERAQVLGRLDDIVPGSAQGLLPTFVVKPFVWGIREVPRLVPNGIEPRPFAVSGVIVKTEMITAMVPPERARTANHRITCTTVDDRRVPG